MKLIVCAKRYGWKIAIVAIITGLNMVVAVVSGHATLIVESGLVGGSGDVDNVIFESCVGAIAGPALTVQGCLNTSDTTLVNFTSNENLITNGGQAKINAQDGFFDTVTIALADSALGFSKLQFNLDVTTDATAHFEGIDQFGTIFDFGSFDLGGSGSNFFTLSSADNQVAVSFKVVSTAPIQSISDLQQVRLGPTEVCTQGCTATTATQIPEPSTILLLGSGLLVVARAARRKRG